MNYIKLYKYIGKDSRGNVRQSEEIKPNLDFILKYKPQLGEYIEIQGITNIDKFGGIVKFIKNIYEPVYKTRCTYDIDIKYIEIYIELTK